jgi:hypothetical protein
MPINSRHKFAKILLCSGLLGLSACAGSSQPSKYYVLSVTEPNQPRDPNGPAVTLGPVTLAKYLDRPQIVTRPTPNELDVDEFNRWGGRLEDNVAQVLSEDIARRLKTARIAVFPPEPAGRSDVRVAVTITRFERVGTAGDCVLEARWRITRSTAPASAEPTLGTFAVTKKAGGSGFTDTVAAMSAALGDLSVALSDAVGSGPAVGIPVGGNR